MFCTESVPNTTLVINHLPSVCQAYRTVTNGCVQDGGPPWCSTKTDSYDNHIGNGGHWGDCAPCPTGTTATPVRSTQMACNPGTKCLSTWCHCPLGSKWECVDPDWICDDTEDCDNGEDEKGCGVTATPAKTVTTTTTG